MSKNLTQVFKNDHFTVRSITDENGEIWFVARDVAQALDYSKESLKNTIKLFKNVPGIWRDRKRITVTSDKTRARPYQDMLCLTEQGLYFFLGRSDKPSALPFQMWIAGEVIPSIRKHGMYLTPKILELFKNDPKVLDKLVENYLSEKDRTRRLEKELAEAQTFATLGRCVLAMPESITVQDAAHLLAQKGLPIGQNRLYAKCREKGLLCRRKVKQWNKPTQKAIEQKLFNAQIEGGFKTVAMVTPQGLNYLLNFLTSENYPLIVLMEAQNRKAVKD